MPLDPLTTAAQDRLSLLAHNAIRRDWGGAVGAVFSPDSLSPVQRGLEEDPNRKGWIPKGDDPWSKVLRAVGNPMVIMAAVLAFRYPPATAEALLKWGGKMKSYSDRLWPGVWRLQTANTIFRGTPFLRVMEDILDNTHEFQKGVMSIWSQGLNAVKKTVGRVAGFPEQIATSVLLDGLDNPANQSWQVLRKTLYKRLETRAAEFGGPEGLQAFVNRVGVVQDAGRLRALAPEALVNSSREALGWAWKEMFKEGQYERLVERKYGKMVAAAEKRYAKDPVKLAEAMRKISLRKESGEDILDVLESQGLEMPTFSRGRERDQFLLNLKKAVTQGNFKYIDGYFPHISQSRPAEQRSFLQGLLDATPGVKKARSKNSLLPLTKQLEARRGGLIPSLRDLDYLKGVFTPETYKVRELLTDSIKAEAEAAMRTGNLELADEIMANLPREYSLRLGSVMQHYSNGMAKTYAWTAKGLGTEFKSELEKLDRLDPQGFKRNLAYNTYLPAIMGRLDEGEMVQQLAWSDRKVQAYNFFGKDWVKKLVSPKVAAKLQEVIASPTVQDLTWKNAGAKIAGMEYLNTLGLNASSAGLNLMQNLMTTSSVVEGKYLLKGLSEVTKGGEKFVSLIGKNGRTLEQAFAEAFPQYITHIGDPSEIETMTNIRQALAGGGTWAAKTEKVKKWLMGMFTGTERFNKLWAYEAGKAKGLAEGLDEMSSQLLGKRVMQMTQFPGGPLGTASTMVNWWAPFRQFTQFPIRTMELALSSPSTLARSVLYGGAIYGLGKEFAGVDLGRGLIFGAAPVPDNPESPFYPLPIVPPILQLAGSATASLVEGDMSKLQRSLPLMIPGGVALARASSAMSPYAAKMFGREYADWSNPQPNGTVPVMSADGQLKGFKSPLQIYSKAIGFQSLTGDPEAELAKYLVGQRDKIRDYRRQYIEAMAMNDMAKADSIQSQYQKAYPKLGPIELKKTDIQAVETRHMVSRLERIISTMPPEARDEFGSMVGVAMGQAGEQFMGVDPALLAGTNRRQRDAARTAKINLSMNNLDSLSGDQPVLSGIRADQRGNEPSPAFGDLSLSGF